MSYIFQEDDRSGMETSKRSEFLKMFQLVSSKQVDVIVVYKWDRFARLREDSGTWVSYATSHGCYVMAGDQTVIVKDAASNLTQSIMWDLNEYYARDSAEKTYDTQITRALGGERMGRCRPFWLY